MSLLAERLDAQLLGDRRARSPLPVVERLLAIQAQDPRGARLAIRARSVGVTAADVDAALSDARLLVVSWLNRGTLHLVRTEDYPWLQTLTTPQLRTATARRLSQEGVSADAAERGVEVIAQALSDGPLDRDGLRDRVAAAGVRTEGQALVHLLVLASIRGLIVRGPMVDGRQAFVLVRDWLPRSKPVARASRSPSWHGATWQGTVRRIPPTWRSGPAFRFATRAPPSQRSPPSSTSATTASSRSHPAPATRRSRSPSHCCSERSSLSCSGGSPAA